MRVIIIVHHGLSKKIALHIHHLSTVEHLIFSLCPRVSTCYDNTHPLRAWQPKKWQMTTCYCDNSEKWYRPTHHPKRHGSYWMLVMYIHLKVWYFQIWLQFSEIMGQTDPDLKCPILYCFTSISHSCQRSNMSCLLHAPLRERMSLTLVVACANVLRWMYRYGSLRCCRSTILVWPRIGPRRRGS